MKAKKFQVKGTAANEHVTPRRLLIMACGAAKFPGVRRACEKYAGTTHKTRAAVERETGWKGFELLILSAEFGLTKASTHLPDYDRRMSPERAREQAGLNVPMLRQIIEDARRDGGRPFAEVFVFCSPVYALALGDFSEWSSGVPVRVVNAGRGIGDQTAELKAWILERGEPAYTTVDEKKSESLEEWLSRRPHLREPVRDDRTPRVCWLQSPTLEEWLQVFPSMRRAAML